jgi:hypothetical protein
MDKPADLCDTLQRLDPSFAAELRQEIQQSR